MKGVILLIGTILFLDTSSILAHTYEEASIYRFVTSIQTEDNRISSSDTLDRLEFIRLSLEHQSIQTIQEQVDLLEWTPAEAILGYTLLAHLCTKSTWWICVRYCPIFYHLQFRCLAI